MGKRCWKPVGECKSCRISVGAVFIKSTHGPVQMDILVWWGFFCLSEYIWVFTLASAGAALVMFSWGNKSDQDGRKTEYLGGSLKQYIFICTVHIHKSKFVS